ncbi:MAG: ABC transporter permease [candidate division WOR-3 bacterium]|nr:ABC transporter permease [candidate division WOR-3 bacterium]MCX7757721.1 ABC transporter permease [candidate division WOR-3 bacterium]MDW7988176.1 ABC transporter permease [candidate division WOR-3 bacterium]
MNGAKIFYEIFNFIWFPFSVILASGKPKRTIDRLFDQLYEIGIESLPLIFVTSVFLGLVITIQTYYQISGMLPKYFLGLTVGRMVMIELAPVLSGLVITGRSVSAMAAEIGSMKITEQLDALRVMKIDPKYFLAQPRLLAVVIITPILNGVMLLVTLLIGAIYAQLFYHTDLSVFFYGLTHPFAPRIFWVSFIKSTIFGFWCGASGLYYGFKVEGGTKEVGKAVTNAIVTATVLILVLDFLVALIFF